jgi:ABC-2 type transport system ATP-binding protein
MEEQKDDFDDVDGIRVLGLSKTFKSIISQDEVKALKNVYFNLKKGELLGIMGHNGAGKSTLINLICGAVNKDSGNARIFKNNIEDDICLARKRMGVVTQFDVLWDELTGIEHMQLF